MKVYQHEGKFELIAPALEALLSGEPLELMVGELGVGSVVLSLGSRAYLDSLRAGKATLPGAVR